jgi:hypothetical protein
MPTTVCPRCQVDGFVRYEHVIKAGVTRRHYYCGKCEHTWAVEERRRARMAKASSDSTRRRPRKTG